jgi:hypothetical protein
LPINTATYRDVNLPDPLPPTPFVRMVHALSGGF